MPNSKPPVYIDPIRRLFTGIHWSGRPYPKRVRLRVNESKGNGRELLRRFSRQAAGTKASATAVIPHDAEPKSDRIQERIQPVCRIDGPNEIREFAH